MVHTTPIYHILEFMANRLSPLSKLSAMIVAVMDDAHERFMSDNVDHP